MNTPIHDFLQSYAQSGTVRAHMPGHKGRIPLDITEIKGADSLFEASGIIAESEKNASDIFNSRETVYSCGGSTLCIQAMLTPFAHGTAAAGRNAHRAFINACIMLDIRVKWIYPDDSTFVSGDISADAVRRAVTEGEPPSLVYITSPDYLGHIADIDGIAAVCRENGIPLAVDNAHGAYLRFVCGNDGKPLHPLFHGADICCDSAHKTLPVLTGGAYLHTSRESRFSFGDLKQNMALFGSSSPSYLIMDSLDMCNLFMDDVLSGRSDPFGALAKRSTVLKASLRKAGFTLTGSECGKLTVYAPDSGYTGNELADMLRARGIECEYSDSVNTVLMLTGLTTEELGAVQAAFEDIPMKKPFAPDIFRIKIHTAATDLRTAFFSPCEVIPTKSAAGRICARAVTACPPGVAVTVGGEIFLKEDIPLLLSQGTETVYAVKTAAI